MSTVRKPRITAVGKNVDLSVNELIDIPLKRRLEILFASNIIPCRRQLALKYNLSEQLIHNILSHRRYLLENWKYNADPKSLLSKLELENAIAMTELLIEWKHRVELNGLQITEAALERKAAYLQRVLNVSNDIPSENWWKQFDLSWEYKQFKEYGNDSLEMEDILNDLQWMFSKNAYRRLIFRLQQARNGQRGNYRNAASDTEMKTDQTESEYIRECHDTSDIKAEPHYYNDDDFECEDYEFVMDEEAVVDALRKELDDLEQAKYQQYLLGSINSELIIPDQLLQKQNNDDDEDDEDRNGNEKVAEKNEDSFIKAGTVNDDNSNDYDSFCSTNEHKIETIDLQSSPALSLEPDFSLESDEKIDDSVLPSPTIDQSVSNAPTTSDAFELDSVSVTTPPLQPKPFKRKPRNSCPILSLRKDYVRLPAAKEIVQMARRQCLEQLLQESSDASDIEFKPMDSRRKPKKPRKPRKKKINAKKSDPYSIPAIESAPISVSESASVSLSVSSTLTTEVLNSSFSENVQQINDGDAKMDLDGTAASISSNQSPNCESFDDVKQELPSPIVSDVEEFIDEGGKVIENSIVAHIYSQPVNAEQNNNEQSSKTQWDIVKVQKHWSIKNIEKILNELTYESMGQIEDKFETAVEEGEEEEEGKEEKGEGKGKEYEGEGKAKEDEGEGKGKEDEGEGKGKEDEGEGKQDEEGERKEGGGGGGGERKEEEEGKEEEGKGKEEEGKGKEGEVFESRIEIPSKDIEGENSQPNMPKRRIARTRKVRNRKKRINPVKRSTKEENVENSAKKRVKRRKNDCDLTLRKDKIRISQMRVGSENEMAGPISSNVTDEADVELLFESYVNDDKYF